MPTPGKLELTIKINEFPVLVRTLESGWKQFDIDTGNQVVTISVKPKIFKKLEQAQENYPQWVAAIAGQMGEKMDSGFVLKESNIQVFERKSRETLEPTTVATSVASAVEHSWVVATFTSGISSTTATARPGAVLFNPTDDLTIIVALALAIAKLYIWALLRSMSWL